MLKVKVPVYQSEEYHALRELMKKAAPAAAPTTIPTANGDSSTVVGKGSLTEREDAIWRQMEEFDTQFNEIIKRREHEVAAFAAEVRMQSHSATAQHFATLDAEVANILASTRSSGAGAKKRRQQQDRDGEGLMTNFLQQANSLHKSIMSQYDCETHRLAARIRRQNKKHAHSAKHAAGGRGKPTSYKNGFHTADTAAVGSAGADKEGENIDEPWKIELERKLTELHEKKLQYEVDEAAADKKTVVEIAAMPVSRQQGSGVDGAPSSVEAEYMESVVDNLVNLHLDINETYMG